MEGIKGGGAGHLIYTQNSYDELGHSVATEASDSFGYTSRALSHFVVRTLMGDVMRGSGIGILVSFQIA